MITSLKLNDELELSNLVDELCIPFKELSYVELDIDFLFIVGSYIYNVYELEIGYICNVQLVDNENCILTLDSMDNIAILYWVCNYKNIYDILFKLWSDYETARKTS